jgi:hypothetical protein
MEYKNVTKAKEEQEQDTQPACSSGVKSGELFVLPEMRPVETAAFGMSELRICES